MRGTNVKKIQEALGTPQKEIDGIYGPITEKAVKDFQKEKELMIDGIVGENIWGKLFGS